MYSDNLPKLLRELKLDISYESLRQSLEQHEEYPSISTLTDLLNSLSIRNKTLRIPAVKLARIDAQLICVCKNSEEEYFVLVDSILAGQVKYFDTNAGWQVLPLRQFEDIYAGVATVVLPYGRTKDIYAKKRSPNVLEEVFQNRRILVPLLIIAGVITAGFVAKAGNHFSLLFLLSDYIGLYLSIMLTLHAYDSNVLADVCSIGKNINCLSVISSKESKLFGILKLSTLGAIWFASEMISIIICSIISNFSQITGLLNILNLLAITVLPYSLFIQWRLIKKWCILCLLVLGVIISKAIGSHFSNFGFEVHLSGLFVLLFSVTVASLIILLFESYIDMANREKQNAIRLMSFAKSKRVFRTLASETKIVTLPEQEFEIILGDRQADLRITVVASVSCTFCGEFLRKFVSELDNDDESFSLRIFLVAGNSEIEDSAILNLMALPQQAQREGILKLFDRKKTTWPYTFGVHREEAIRKSLHIQNEWILQQGITSTPRVLFNESIVPHHYVAEDVIYHARLFRRY